MEPDESGILADIIAGELHEKVRALAPAGVLDEEHRLPWTECDADYCGACTDAIVDLLDRGLIVPGESARTELARRLEMAVGRG